MRRERLLRFLILVVALGLSACSKGGGGASGNAAPASGGSQQLSWDQGNWNQTNWQ